MHCHMHMSNNYHGNVLIMGWDVVAYYTLILRAYSGHSFCPREYITSVSVMSYVLESETIPFVVKCTNLLLFQQSLELTQGCNLPYHLDAHSELSFFQGRC